MRIANKKKFITRVLEILVIIATIILTVIAIKAANLSRGYDAFGGEYLIPIAGLIIVIIIDAIYEDSEKRGGKHAKR